MTLTLNLAHAPKSMFPFAQIPDCGAPVRAVVNAPIDRQRPRTSALIEGMSKMQGEADRFPEWFDQLDLVEVDSCSCAELAELVVSAPAEFTKGMLFGKLSLRIQLAAITGRGGFVGQTPQSDAWSKIRPIEDQFQKLATSYQDWFAQLDFVDPDYCSRDELEDLMLTAPTDLVQGMMFGKLSLRIQMAGLTGRAFS